MRPVLSVVLLVVLLGSCTQENACEEQLTDLVPEVKIERLEQEMFSLQSPEEVAAFLERHPVMTEQFLGAYQYPHDSILANNLFRRMSNPSLDTVRLEVEQTFGDMSDIEAELRAAFTRIKQYYPDFEPPVVKTIITGFGSSEMYVTDSLIVIGLEYYIGPEATYRPMGVPQYILKRYQKAYMIPAIMLLLSNFYIEEDPADNSMMADMIFYGKKFYYASHMLPCTPDSLLIWYEGQQVEDVIQNQHIIWAHFIENELLFETSHITKKKYLDERPTTLEIGTKCPGRIGTWVGWEIVKSYMNENPGISLPQLMQEKDALKIFSQSDYKPESGKRIN